MKIKHLLIAFAAIAAVVVAWLAIPGGDSEKNPQGPAAMDKKAKAQSAVRKPLLKQKNAAVSAVKPLPTPSRGPGSKGGGHGSAASKGHLTLRFPGLGGNSKWDGIYRDDNGKAYPKEDQDVMTVAARAIEYDDLDAAREISTLALNSKNRDLRESVVDALGWFGKDSIAELLPFVSDADEDVADTAVTHLMSALQDIDDDGEKAGLIEMTLKGLTNKDLIEDVANELIGIDELAAVQVIANLVENEGPVREALKDVYDSITGEDWNGVDAAENWLQENYTPDDDD